MRVEGRLPGLAAEAPTAVLATAAAGLGRAGAGVALALLTGEALAAVLRAQPLGAGLVIGLLAAVIAVAGLEWFRERLAQRAALAAGRRLRARAYRHLLALGPAPLVRESTGALQHLLTDGVAALETYLASYLPQLAVALLATPLAVAVAAAIDPLAGLVLALGGAVVVAAPLAWRRALESRNAARWEVYRQLSARFLEGLQGLPTLKALGAGRRYGHALAADTRAVHARTLGAMRVSLVSSGIVGLAVAAAAVGATALAADRGAAAAGVLALPFLAIEVVRPLTDLSRLFHRGRTAVAAGGELFALLDREPTVTEPSRPAPAPDGSLPPAIAFEDVTVTYPGADRPAVDAVCFRVEPGETVALVGPSGAGKTTCTALLLRFLDPDRGRVTLGGVDVRDLRLGDLRGLVALVAQDTILFAGSLEENLRLAAPEASAERIADAVAAADLDVLVAALPEGLTTPVGERGVRLSGGERQRVAVARALLADAPVLVLDEATASVDAASEAVIGAALDRLRQGRTTLVVAHRSSTVSAADRVVELPAHGPVAVRA